MSESRKNTRKESELADELRRTGVAMSSSELVDRFGSANAEYIKGYTGFDHETGAKLQKGLRDIAGYKVNPDYAEQNIKQQAGFSAEIATTSKDNAGAIISKSKVRTMRSDDHSAYGNNHNVVDRIQVLDGQIIHGSETQMKFVGNRDKLFSDIAKVDGKFSRYRGVKLELPSEQFEGAKEACLEKAEQLTQQANKLNSLGKSDQANKILQEADNYKDLAESVTDSGLTTEEAIFYRENPTLATLKDIAGTSHKAGMQGAAMGAAIGGGLSVAQNVYSFTKGDKELFDAAIDVAKDVATSGALGYGTAAVGSAAKGLMQHSSSEAVKTLARTNLPAQIVNFSVSLSGSVRRYFKGEITEGEFLTEIGEKGSNVLASSMMAAFGQIAIPIPVVGAVVGGLIGTVLSSSFYKIALESSVSLDASRQNLERVTKFEQAARLRIAKERASFTAFMSQELPQLELETESFLNRINSVNENVDFLAGAINEYAKLLGKDLEFSTQKEFDSFMLSDEPLKL